MSQIFHQSTFGGPIFQISSEINQYRWVLILYKKWNFGWILHLDSPVTFLGTLIFSKIHIVPKKFTPSLRRNSLNSGAEFEFYFFYNI